MRLLYRDSCTGAGRDNFIFDLGRVRGLFLIIYNVNLRCLYFSGGEGGSAHIDHNLKYVLIFKELSVQFQDKKPCKKINELKIR